jgi:hypothetical protein
LRNQFGLFFLAGWNYHQTDGKDRNPAEIAYAVHYATTRRSVSVAFFIWPALGLYGRASFKRYIERAAPV